MTVRNDLDLYERHADRLWAEDDRFFRSLRSVGDFHLGLVAREWGAELAGSDVVELGCGGGRMALALQGLGARVVGVDLSAGSLAAARAEGERRGAEASFLRADLTATPLAGGAFDFALLCDVLEHLEAPVAALREAARLLRPGGRLFLCTFDRSALSGLMVVTVAEGLGLVPRGTHDPRLFVRPAELERYGAPFGLRLERLVWERPALGRSLRTWTIHLREAKRGFGYSAFLRKEDAPR